MIYIAFFIFTFSVLVFAFYQWQYFMVFTPTYYRKDEELDDNFEFIYINTDDGIELEGVVYEPQNSSSKKETILFFAGRSDDSVGMIKKLSLSFKNSRIITFNYRSYGKSGGKVSEKNIFSDSQKIARLVEKNYGSFYLLGFSLGSVVASHVASKEKNLALFLVATFDSLSLLVKKKYGFSLSPFLRYKFDNIKNVKEIETPIYMFASLNDEITYIENARNLKTNIKKLSYYKELEGLKHKEVLWDEKVVNKINEVIS